MKKRRNKSTPKQQTEERCGPLEHGPADPMPDGSKRIARTDAISYMANNGQLSPTEETAAREIERVYTSICAGLFPKVQNFERMSGGTARLDEARDIDAARRYRAFADWSAAHRTPRNLHEILIDVLVDGLSAQQLERRHRMRNGSGSLWVRRGLRQYALLSGWARVAA